MSKTDIINRYKAKARLINADVFDFKVENNQIILTGVTVRKDTYTVPEFVDCIGENAFSKSDLKV